MDIVAIIRELLFSHDCVIIPGFGGFIGNYSPARADKDSCTFYPPAKLISFNRNLSNNDGLLISRVATAAAISYGDAKKIVEDFVADIRKKLTRGEKVIFDRIGTFINNSEGNVLFEPDRGVNYNLNSYGLAPFQFFAPEGYDVRRRLVTEPYKEIVRNEGLRRYLWRAAVIIPLIGALIAVPLTTDIFKTRVQVTSLNPLINSASDSGAKMKTSGDNTPDTLQAGINKEPAGRVSGEQSNPSENIPASVYEIPAAEYGIITGSFKSESNALLLAEKMTREGYSAQVLRGDNGFYRVSAVRCRSLSEAESFKRNLEARYPGAWIIRLK